MENFPSRSVVVPFVEPFSITEAPIKGSPDLSNTVPCMLVSGVDAVTGNGSAAIGWLTSMSEAIRIADSRVSCVMNLRNCLFILLVVY